MIYNEDTYYVGYHRNVRTLGAVPALVFDTICGLIKKKGIGEVSNSKLLEMLGIKSKSTLIDAINKVIAAGYLERRNGDGRGNKSIYYITEKGTKNIPFITEKGYKNLQERVQIFAEKGTEIAPIINTANNNINKKAEETPTPLNEEMEDFNLFWNLYPGDPDWSHEKENCERVWRLMNEDWRKRLIQQLQNGLRWRKKENDNPIWYLRDYAGQDVKGQLPYVWNGSAQIAKWKNAGEKVIVMMYQEGDRKGCIYCLSENRSVMEAAGAKYIGIF